MRAPVLALLCLAAIFSGPAGADQFPGAPRIVDSGPDAGSIKLGDKIRIGKRHGNRTILAADGVEAAGKADLGKNLFPTLSAPVSTTASGAAGSRTLTVSSAAGLEVGMVAYSSLTGTVCSVPNTAFQSPFIKAISGNTVTMSCPLARSGTASVQFGLQRFDPDATTRTNTLMARTGLFGSAARGASTGWLADIAAGFDYPETGIIKVLSSPGYAGAMVVGSRTSDATGGAPPIPFTCLFYADTWANVKDGWCAYLQSNLTAASAGQSNHIQTEASVNSLWPSVELDSFSGPHINNSTILHRYDCGTGQQGGINLPNDCSTGLDFVY